ncbi:MAG: SDR family oxidoreductase [Chthoniobacterales bacterium]
MKADIPKRIFITGANRGIGLEFVTQFLKRGATVFAACRDTGRAEDLLKLKATYPETCFPINLDVADTCSLGAAFEAVQAKTDTLDLLINNAAHTTNLQETLPELKSEIMMRHFQVNSVAPVLITQKFLKLLRKGNTAKVATISSEAGSFNLCSGLTSFRGYSYHASKAALNMFMLIVASELRADNIPVITLHPGFVRTRPTNSHALLSTTESVEGMLRVIEKLTLENSGGFYGHDGGKLNW